MPHKKTTFSAGAIALAAALLLSACGDSPEKLMASARDYLAKNDYSAAAIQIKNVLQQQPDSAEARYLLGLALLNSGDAAGAEIELRKARELKHDDNLVVPKLATALVRQGKARPLIELFGATSLSSPTATAELQTALGTAYMVEKNAAAARAALDKAVAAEPHYADALLMQARHKLGERDVAGAQAIVDGVLQRDAKNSDALRLKGNIVQMGQNKPDEALALYRQAVEAQPRDPRNYFATLGVLIRQNKLDEADKDMAALKKLAPKHPETMYLDAQLALVRRDFAKARELAQELLRIAPGNARALELAGGIDLQRNALVTAEEQLSKALQAEPGLPMARRWLATTYMRSGQAAKAQSTLAPLVEANSQDPGLLALAGEVALMSGDSKRAEDLFARASKLDPDDARKRTALAVTQMVGGQTAAGLEQLQDIAASDKGTSADMALVSTYMRRGDHDKALQAIASLEKKTGDSPLPAQLRGRVLLAKGDLAGARQSFEASLAKNPNFFASIASLAALDVNERKPQDARKRFEDLLQREPRNARAMVALAELRGRAGGPDAAKDMTALLKRAIDADPAEMQPRVLLIDHLLRVGEPKEAMTIAQAALTALPDNPAVLDAAGRAQIAGGDTQQGLTTLARAATLQPKAVPPLLRLADAQRSAKNLAGAEQSLRRALDLQPDAVEAYGRLISIRLEQDRLQDAVGLARTVQKRQPKLPAGYLLEGDARVTKQDLAGAISAYQAGLKAAPSSDLLVRLHATLRRAGKQEEAERAAAQWLQSQPRDIAVPMYLADVALADRRLDEAERQYQRVIKQQPNHALAYNNLAWVSGELKRNNALGYAQKAVELAPNQAAFLDTLAMLQGDGPDIQKAIETQRKVLDLQGDNPLFKLNMARLQAKAGNKSEARKLLDEVKALGDKFPGQAEVDKLRATL